MGRYCCWYIYTFGIHTCTPADYIPTHLHRSEMELFPGGSAEFVVYDTREQFCDLLQDYRLHEFDAQINAIARGLYAIVPRNTLLLLTWREFEILVCGNPSFDMDFWRAHTTYSGYAEDDVTITLFWKVLESLTQEEQSGFVRFAWGRSRLPPKNAWFKDMQVSGRERERQSVVCIYVIDGYVGLVFRCEQREENQSRSY